MICFKYSTTPFGINVIAKHAALLAQVSGTQFLRVGAFKAVIFFCVRYQDASSLRSPRDTFNPRLSLQLIHLLPESPDSPFMFVGGKNLFNSQIFREVSFLNLL